MPRPSSQSGQALLFLALFAVVLCGMLGLVVDGGLAQHEKLVSQAAADGAALAAAYKIQAYPYTGDFTSANAAAAAVIAQDGLPPSALTSMSYLHADRTAASKPSDNVRYVLAAVSFSTPTAFLRVLGVTKFTVSSSAGVLEPSFQGTCVFCLMAPSGNDIHLVKNVTITATNGALYVDSSDSNGAIKFDSTGDVITAPGIFVVGGWQASASNFILPLPESGVPAIGDPLALAPTPVVAGPLKVYTPAPAVTLDPGIYAGINVPTGDKVTMNPGTYVIIPNTTKHAAVAGLVLGSGSTLVANKVTIYLGCVNYPTPCGSGEIGGILDDEGGIVTISPPTSGTFQGMSVYADRLNSGINIVDQGGAVAGTWYTLGMQFKSINANSLPTITINVGMIVTASFNLVSNTTFILNYVPGSSYFPPGGFVPLDRLTLEQ